jgi:hypothetical protein
LLQEFHTLVKQCSRPAAGGTVHFMHSMNWVRDVKGATHIELLMVKLAALEAGRDLGVMVVNEVSSRFPAVSLLV